MYTRPPRVLVPPEHWELFCQKLMEKGAFDRHEDDLHRIDGTPVPNGLFGVSKQEFDGPCESMRIIISLVPVNSAGWTGTSLPCLHGKA